MKKIALYDRWIKAESTMRNWCKIRHDTLCIPNGFQRSSIRATIFLFDNALDSLFYGNWVMISNNRSSGSSSSNGIADDGKDNDTEAAAMTAIAARMERWALPSIKY